MANLFAWLIAAIGPLATKVLTALGIGWISYEGMSLIADQVRDIVVGLWGGLPSYVLDILALGGISQSVGITLSALSARAGLAALSRLGKLG